VAILSAMENADAALVMRPRSRPSDRAPNVEGLDVRLQSDNGLVRTLRQPDDHYRKRDCDISCPEWPCGKGARHGNLSAHLNGLFGAAALAKSTVERKRSYLG
jgi:hypothetical protein